MGATEHLVIMGRMGRARWGRGPAKQCQALEATGRSSAAVKASLGGGIFLTHEDPEVVPQVVAHLQLRQEIAVRRLLAGGYVHDVCQTGQFFFMSNVPPGWYQDPLGGSQFRWWDGSAWTEHLQTPQDGAHSTPRETTEVIENGTPAGWYTDPRDPKGVRYWDGQAWAQQDQRSRAAQLGGYEKPVDYGIVTPNSVAGGGSSSHNMWSALGREPGFFKGLGLGVAVSILFFGLFQIVLMMRDPGPTEPQNTSKAPTTILEKSTPTTLQNVRDYPEEVRDAFMDSCVSSTNNIRGAADACLCALEAFEEEFSFEEYTDWAIRYVSDGDNTKVEEVVENCVDRLVR